jgi:hypothetical protein
MALSKQELDIVKYEPRVGIKPTGRRIEIPTKRAISISSWVLRLDLVALLL